MRYLILTLFIFLSISSNAQGTTDSYQQLNLQRLHTNMAGMQVLAGWGVVNTIAGVAGYLSTDKEESQRFHQMNTIWGIINLGIAGSGYLGVRKELSKNYTCAQALQRYKSTRRLFLINAGLDGLYIGTGIYLNAKASHTDRHPEVLRGYGTSILLQGIGLLAFDVVMYSSHNAKNKAWKTALNGVCVTGSGIGWHCSL